MVVQTFTIKEFQNYLNRLPSKLQKYSGDINQEIAKSLQRRIRFRAPGNLKDTTLKGNKKSIKLLGYAHWPYVELGLYPKHPIPIQAIELNKGNPGITAGKKLRRFIKKEDITGYFQPGPSSSKGFVSKSIVSLNEELPSIVERGLNKAFSK